MATPAPSQEVSCVVAVMNRKWRVLDGIQNWFLSPQVKEVVVVDWSSTDGLRTEDLLSADPRVRVIRAERERRWILTHAYNLAIDHARYPVVLKMDADYRMEKDLIRLLPPKTFMIRSPHQVRRGQVTDFERNLEGFVMFHREEWDSINGYDERIVLYGKDDIDFYDRMAQMGCTRLLAKYRAVSHTPHTSRERVINQPIDNPNAGVQAAKWLLANRGQWGREFTRSTWETLSVEEGGRVQVVRRTSWPIHF